MLEGGLLGPRLGEGREADVYACGDAAVVKLYRPGFGGHLAETQALRSLDGLLQRRPWRVFEYGGRLAQIHRAVHIAQAPAGLADLRDVMAARIGDADLPQQLLDYVLRVFDGLPDGDRLCHGDYHPGNVLIAADRAAVIDWGAAARGAPDADHARTLLLLRWSHPLPSTPLLSRAHIAAGRSLLAALRICVRTGAGCRPRSRRAHGLWCTPQRA